MFEKWRSATVEVGMADPFSTTVIVIGSKAAGAGVIAGVGGGLLAAIASGVATVVSAPVTVPLLAVAAVVTAVANSDK